MASLDQWHCGQPGTDWSWIWTAEPGAAPRPIRVDDRQSRVWQPLLWTGCPAPSRGWSAVREDFDATRSRYLWAIWSEIDSVQVVLYDADFPYSVRSAQDGVLCFFPECWAECPTPTPPSRDDKLQTEETEHA